MMKTKAAVAELDWPITWTLEAGETISSSTWSVTPAGEMAVKAGSPSITGLVTACILTGGVFRKVYEVTNTIVTSAGRTHAQTITFRIGAVEAV
jgi:hypothetical protein